MNIFINEQDCIQKVQAVIQRFSNISAIVETADYAYWQSKLSALANFELDIFQPPTKMNILTTGIIIAQGEAGYNSVLAPHASNLFHKLNNWLEDFPHFLKDKSFKKKIKNLEGLNFLSSLSELSLAAYLKSNHYTLEFEKKFNQVTSGTRKDVDITATDAAGNTINFEVYMPSNETEIEGFFDPHNRNGYFEYKVAMKLDNKFGADGFSGLNGKVFLAVNYAFFDEIYINAIFPFFGNDKVFSLAKNSLPADVNGVLFFRDNFAAGTSLYIDRLIVI